MAVGDWAALNDAAPTYDDVERPVREQPLRRAAIRVGDGAVLGPHASLGPGATVAAGEAVAAYAVRRRGGETRWRGGRRRARAAATARWRAGERAWRPGRLTAARCVAGAREPTSVS